MYAPLVSLTLCVSLSIPPSLPPSPNPPLCVKQMGLESGRNPLFHPLCVLVTLFVFNVYSCCVCVCVCVCVLLGCNGSSCCADERRHQTHTHADPRGEV